MGSGPQMPLHTRRWHSRWECAVLGSWAVRNVPRGALSSPDSVEGLSTPEVQATEQGLATVPPAGSYEIDF